MSAPGAGPFSAEKAEFDCLLQEVVEVVDEAGNTFCIVFIDDCAGADLPAAKARATRIAEALNRSVFASGEAKLTLQEYQRRAGVIIGAEFVYPEGGER